MRERLEICLAEFQGYHGYGFIIWQCARSMVLKEASHEAAIANVFVWYFENYVPCLGGGDLTMPKLDSFVPNGDSDMVNELFICHQLLDNSFAS